MAGYRGSNINPKRFERGQIKIILGLLPLALFMGIPIVFIFCHAFKPMDELLFRSQHLRIFQNCFVRLNLLEFQ